MNIECRDITDVDYTQWCRFYADYAKDWKEDISQTRLDGIWNMIARDKSVWGVVSLNHDKVPTGFALIIEYPCTYSRRQVGYIQDLYVSPEYRRKEAGKTMMEYIYNEAKKKGLHELTWKTTQNNSAAQAMYDKIAHKSSWVHYELQCFSEKEISDV